MTAVTSHPDQAAARGTRDKRSYLTILHSDWLLIFLPLASIALWVGGLVGANPRDMDDLGLLSLLGPTNVLALVFLTAGFLIGLQKPARERFLALQLLTFLALIHATPAVLYGTVRYSWSWKHIGIVDYILRHGAVDPTIDVSGIYHSWPGFFAGSALLTAVAGRDNLFAIASWAPFAFNVINLLVLRFVLRGLTEDKRLIWLSLWFFFLINWVGQDYFSPQAMAYVLYLAAIGLLIRGVTGWPRLILFILFVTTVGVSHQLTPIMLFIAVTGLVAFRRTSGWHLPVIAFMVPLAWALSVAQSYTVSGFFDFISTFGQPLQNANETLEKASVTNLEQGLVVWGGRSVVALSAIVALVGVWRCWRNHTLQLTAVLLMVLPGLLLVITGFDGEILFRVTLFAAPFIAFSAATAVLPKTDRQWRGRTLVAIAAVTVLFLPGFLLGYYGKERQNYFTPGEVRAAAWISDNALPGSLLVEGSRNYPAQFRNYEYFVYVPIDREPPESWSAIVADPAGVLTAWLSNPRYTDSYVLITRSQKMEVNAHGPLPPGSLEAIDSALRRSPQFQVVFDTGDATVFVLRAQ